MSGSTRFLVEPGGKLAGKVRVPGDKSISHRFVMLASLAEGPSTADGFLEGADALATVAAFRAMGVVIDGPNAGVIRVEGVGLNGLKKPQEALYLGNAGTAMRLICGILSGQRFAVELTGDSSLSKRPMRRVTEPLALMGAKVATGSDGTPPIRIQPVATNLHGVEYRMPVASAQVKSCLLLAGMYATGKTCLIEPAPTRDHTERMLEAFGLSVERDGATICLSGGQTLRGCDMTIPADISSAAFFIIGAAISPGSDLLLEAVGVNPTRTGVLDILKLMGARIELRNQRTVGGEPVADIRVQGGGLRGAVIPPELVPLAIDEFPALFVAAACADGRTEVRGAQELRVKESDRIAVMAENLRAIGVDLEELEDGMVINGGTMTSGVVHAREDHRIAMALAVAGLRCEGELWIDDCDNVDTSFPGFVELANTAGLRIRAVR